MTPQQIEALKLALGALEIEEAQTHYPSQFLLRAITAIKEALAEHAMRETQRLGQEIEQEPLEYWNAVEGWVKIDEVREHFDSVGCATIYKTAGEGRVPLSLAKAQPEQEPHGWYIDGYGAVIGTAEPKSVRVGEWLPWYTTPPQRTWVNLTDEDRNDCLVEADPCECLATPEAQELMRCVEAKSRSKNQ